MNKFALRLLGATTLAIAVASPALADESDKVFVNEMRDKIAQVRAEPGVAQNGSAELDRAEDALKALQDNLDDNETGQVKNIRGEIGALIETARTRAMIATVKKQIADLGTANTSRVANAEAAAQEAQQSAAVAQADAAKANAEANKLRAQMQAYQLQQTQLGATLVLSDVVFETGKADLKPGAADRLRPLAAYLQANPNVKVRIDGHTDAQGSDTYNQQLSNNRAVAVGTALASMGVDAGRIQAVGHGEAKPVADNNSQAGRQQNRRVEVTLVGQQAASFAALAR
jgi:outer membrane protein OmpA-like peptidoglycan-associated protein